jgi:hypothetical protein
MLEQFFDAPLYHALKLEHSSAISTLQGLRTSRGQLDRYCPKCGKSTTWQVSVTTEDESRAKMARAAAASLNGGSISQVWLQDFGLTLRCARDTKHRCTLHFAVEVHPRKPRAESASAPQSEAKYEFEVTVRKVGQYPSLADIQLGNLAEFEDGISMEQRKEFVRAVNTSAHGFNVAACVHYRRVFEGALREAYDEKLRTEGMPDWPDYAKMRTDERIDALKGYVPQFLAEHPHLYTILSKGVHELTEEECGEAMPVLREAIELMLHEKVDAIRREKRRSAASKLIARTLNKLN